MLSTQRPVVTSIPLLRYDYLARTPNGPQRASQAQERPILQPMTKPKQPFGVVPDSASPFKPYVVRFQVEAATQGDADHVVVRDPQNHEHTWHVSRDTFEQLYVRDTRDYNEAVPVPNEGATPAPREGAVPTGWPPEIL